MRIVAPESVGLASEGLRRVDQHLVSRYVEPGKIAGALTLVARRGQVAWLSPLGLMDRERGKPMRADTIFRIYSMTKPVTSVALMMLHERGAFALGDPVHRYLPAWEHLRVHRYGRYPSFVTEPVARPMTVRDLLTHMSGLSYQIMERGPVDEAYRQVGIGGPAGTLRDMVETLATLPLEFSPGTRWSYSVATDVLGYLVEVLSGQRFDDYLRTQIFEPLGMTDTGFTVPADKVGRFAANYVRLPGSTEATIMDDPEDSPYTRPKTLFSGGGGLVSTAADYLRFAEMLRRGGELDGKRPARAADRRLHDEEPPPRRPGSREPGAPGRVQRDALRRHRLRPRRPRRHRSGARPGTGFGRRVRLGRPGLDRVLGRPRRGPGGRVPDAARAVVDLRLPRTVEGDHPRRDRRLTTRL
jgi:CubicO group peptidase (beta-lactamase class C family)